MFEYRCQVVRVIDGDTVDVDIDLGFGVWLKKERVRLVGIDTPESRTRDLEEKKYDAKGKFGRILGELWRTTDHADKSLNEYMIEKHHAVPYHGQSKDDIAEQHLKNREFIDIT